MSFEHLQDNINAAETKEKKYGILLSVVEGFVDSDDHPISKLSNIVAAIHDTFNPLWTGFYVVIDGELQLFPFQGPLACTRIKHGKGVCGQSWAQDKTLVVPDVELFPGHIACSSRSRSEIVLPVHNDEGAVVAVLDIDSEYVGTFDDTDALYLGRLCDLLTTLPWGRLQNI
ncbi:GAF domain-containing protein [Porphyromonas sp.]|uniref:GAF domain-containing protein n=1 Tax=Porphyromonas sp. TaxID=1924944 RepID=UPI0026DBD77A|nr:GAF domain-containing protein [Porphyromonas sp.]MDO4770878.1 GAF domain-containing protein [Porphyromonas sp.]